MPASAVNIPYMIEFICFRDEMHILEPPKVIVVAFFAVNALISAKRGALEIAVPGGGQVNSDHGKAPVHSNCFPSGRHL
jgi:hypothetical protein